MTAKYIKILTSTETPVLVKIMKLLVQTLVFMCCNYTWEGCKKDHNNRAILTNVVLCFLSINMAPLSLATNMTGYICFYLISLKF